MILSITYNPAHKIGDFKMDEQTLQEYYPQYALENLEDIAQIKDIYDNVMDNNQNFKSL
jgi:hypothetical protein